MTNSVEHLSCGTHCHQSDTENGCHFHSYLGVCQSPVGAVTHRPNACSLSSVTPERYEFGPAMINTTHCDLALKVTSLDATIHVQSDRLLLPHSFRLIAVSQSARKAALLLCHCGECEVFPLLLDHLTHTLCSQSAPLFYERNTSCRVGFVTSRKEL